MSLSQAEDVIFVGGKRLISRQHAASLLGLKPESLSTALSRGELQLTRFFRGRAPSFDLGEVEALILSRAVPPGRRVR